MHGNINAWLQQLEGKQREVLVRRFGLHGHEKATLEEVGQELGVTRERVRQIQMEALKRLRRILEGSGYSADNLFIGLRVGPPPPPPLAVRAYLDQGRGDDALLADEHAVGAAGGARVQ